MKTLLFTSFLLLLALGSFAQKKNVVYKDTINLRGYIYDSNGKPVRELSLRSKQLDLTYNKFPLWGRTDTSGYFEIKGAKPYDTLTISTHTLYHKLPLYYNRGSRYIVIYLPPAEDHVEINADTAIIVSHPRMSKKKTPSFKIETFDDDATGDYFDIHVYPVFNHKFSGRTAPWNTRESSQAFSKAVLSLVKYPENAVKNNIEGIVKISFEINGSPSPSNFKILNGIGYGCDEEVINAIKNAGKWMPAINNGRPICVTEIITVNFKLTDK